MKSLSKAIFAAALIGASNLTFANDFGFGSAGAGAGDFGLGGGSSESSDFGFGGSGESSGIGSNPVKEAIGGDGLEVGGMPAMAEPSCGSVICLMNQAGQVPPGCMQDRMTYFSIQVWSPYYNSSATKEARGAYIGTCSTARQQDIQQIQNKYGETMVDPGT